VAIYFAINAGFGKIRSNLGGSDGGADMDSPTDQQPPKEE